MGNMKIVAGCAALALWVLSTPAEADDFTVEFDIIDLNNALWARQPVALPFGASDEGGDIVSLRDPTQPDCAASALRLTRDAMHQTTLGPAALRSVAVSADIATSLLGGVGLRRAANIAEVSMIYLTSESPENFYTDLASWMLGEAVAAHVVDDALAEVSAEVTEGLAGELLAEFRRPIVRGTHDHPQCGAIDLRYSIVPGMAPESYVSNHLGYGAPLLRFYVDGDCNRRWPVNRGDQLGLWRVVAEMPITGTVLDDETLTLTVGDPRYEITALCGDQNDNIAYDPGALDGPPSDILGFLPVAGPTGNWYFIGGDVGTWTQGRAYCEAVGADLAVIGSAEENDFLGDTLAPACENSHGCWIGATDIATEGQFTWIDGSALDLQPWRDGEPNEHCDGEDYVHMTREGTWNDQAVDGSCLDWGLMQPICEMPGQDSTL